MKTTKKLHYIEQLQALESITDKMERAWINAVDMSNSWEDRRYHQGLCTGYKVAAQILAETFSII